VNEGNADLSSRSAVWLGRAAEKGKLVVETSVWQTYGEWGKSEIFKMWIPLLIIMQGERDYVVWYQN
jgi:hypothetical protein